ncbi:MAG TPA: flagellar hook-associated protein FlgL [Clostridiaceae bacterium]|nr:flagellar hook-associated protein FlgL [Clostridiaceae bacterium]
MRITNNMLINNMMQSLSGNLMRTQKYFNQLASGKKISLPSDDPIVASKALKLRTDVSEIAQYKRNTDDATAWMDITEATMSQMTDLVHRMKEITNQAANGTNTDEDLLKIREEASELRSQLISLGNATYAGRYIFSGYKTDKPLLNDDGTYNIDVNNSEQIRFEIGIGDNININVPGSDLFNRTIVGASAGNKSEFVDTFDKVIAAMDSDDKSELSKLLGDLDDELGNLLRVRAGLGARMNRVELAAGRLEDDNVNFTKLMSKNEDVDIAEAIMKLQNEENVYRASLATGARVIQPSLVDFLK